MESFERQSTLSNNTLLSSDTPLDSADVKYPLFAIFSSALGLHLWKNHGASWTRARRSSPERKWLSVPSGRERNGASRLFARWQSIPIAPRFLPRSDSLESIRRIGRCWRIHRITFIHVNYRLVIRIETRDTVTNSWYPSNIVPRTGR